MSKAVVVHRRRRYEYDAQQRPPADQSQAARPARRRGQPDHSSPDRSDRVGPRHLALYAAGAGPHDRRYRQQDPIPIRAARRQSRGACRMDAEARGQAPRAAAARRRASDLAAQGLVAFVDIDRDTAGRFGITPATIDNALYDAFGQRIVSTIYTNTNQYRVILKRTPCCRPLCRRSIRFICNLQRVRAGSAFCRCARS